MNNRQKAKRFKKKYEELKRITDPRKNYLGIKENPLEEHVASWSIQKDSRITDPAMLINQAAGLLAGYLNKDLMDSITIEDNGSNYTYTMKVWVRKNV